MNRFEYVRATDLARAVRAGAAPGAEYLAGGTNVVDLLKGEIARPATLVDVTRLPLREIEELAGGGLRLGALATNVDTAYDPRVAARYPVLSSAILAGASAQLRNAATNGGNLNQRTRCYYFYDPSTPCNKRDPGSGCGALGGVNRVNAILGTSGPDAAATCIATHPSDMCIALAVLEAQVRVTGPDGGSGEAERVIPFAEYHRLPGDEPWRDTTLRGGELVTAIDLPAEGFADHHTYLKLRDRQSYAFALVSAAVVLRVEGGADPGGADRVRRRRAQALARRRRRRALRRQARRGRRRNRRWLRRRRRRAAGRGGRVRRQHVQDRPRAPRGPPRVRAGGRGHAAEQRRQAHRLTAAP